MEGGEDWGAPGFEQIQHLVGRLASRKHNEDVAEFTLILLIPVEQVLRSAR
jgi:hypothetical protein